MRTILLLLFFNIFGLLYAQSPEIATEVWYMGKPIEKIQFEGLNNINLSELEGITSQFIGIPYSLGIYKDLQSKLFALDFFKKFSAEAEPVNSDKNAVIIIFTVEERPLVDELVISGNKRIRKNDILETILLKEDDIFSTTKIKFDENAILDLYHSKGYPNITVKTDVLEQDDSRVKVTFTIVEGNQSRLREIFFSGNTIFSDSTLNDQLSLKIQSLLSSGVFHENMLEADKFALESYYQNHGYIDAKVVEVKRKTVESEKGRNYLSITFYFSEGEPWTFGGMDIDGNLLFSDEKLLSLINHKPGDLINKKRLEIDFARLSDIYYNDGYIYNDIKFTEKRNKQNNSVSYKLNIIEKGRAHIENIIIKGNVKTLDHVLYREIPLVEGDIFSKVKVIAGMQNLYNTRLFSTVVPETPYGSAEGLMDLVINVEEGKNTDINFGITFTGAAEEYPIAGFLKWNEINFRGKGQILSIGTELSPTKQSFTLGFNEKWLMGRRWSVGTNISITNQTFSNIKQDILGVRFTEDQYNDETSAPDPYNSKSEWEAANESNESIDSAYLMKYDSMQLSIGANTGYTFHNFLGRMTTATGTTLSLNKVTYDDEEYRPYNPVIRNNLDKWLFNNKLWINLKWDRRDFIVNPTKGFVLNEIITYAGGLLGGDTHYIKSQSKLEAFFKLTEIPIGDTYIFKTIFAAHTSFSVILDQYYKEDSSFDWNLSAKTRDMLYTDGMNIARGWGFMQDGEAMWDNWIEVRMPIIEKAIWSDLFFSGTSFWQDRSKVEKMTINDFKFSFGAGIRFTIPGLPIGLYLTKRFEFTEDEFAWLPGDLFKDSTDPTSGVDLVIAFQIGLF